MFQELFKIYEAYKAKYLISARIISIQNTDTKKKKITIKVIKVG